VMEEVDWEHTQNISIYWAFDFVFLHA
jgi:hypothetical protein